MGHRNLMSLAPRWAVVVFCVLLALSAAVALAAPARTPVQQGGGVGVDPLTPAEIEVALRAAVVARGVQVASPRRSQPASADQAIITAPADETLLVERHREEKSVMASGQWDRRADVYIYRYGDDTLLHSIYNYATGTAQVVEEAQGVQLPLTQAERSLAVEIAFNDRAAFARFQEEYKRITGGELTSPRQVEIRAFVYHAGANPEMEPPAAATCGLQRCAQLLILSEGNVTFEPLPVVNLSTLSVASIVPVAVETNAAPPAGQPPSSGKHTH